MDSADVATSAPVQAQPAPRPWWRSAWAEALGIALLALTINLLGNNKTSLWDRDEPRYAGCAREMRTSGDYIDPTFNAEPRYHKPILIYWLMQAGVLIGGDNPFGNRLISALAGVGTCLLIWAYGRRAFSPTVGRLAALILATSPMVAIESKLSTTDSALFFFLALSWWSLWELTRTPLRRWAMLFWVSLSLAVLTKGPVGPIFLGATCGVSWLWGRVGLPWRSLRWRWGLPLFVALTAPWYIAIGIISHGQFFEVAMGRHVIHRMTTDMETHGGFPGFYVVGTLLGFYPWSAFLPAALWAAWKRRKELGALGYAAGWWLGPLIVLEIIRTKLIHYFLPAYGGAALVVAWMIEAVALSSVNMRRWPLGRMAFGLLLGVGLVVPVALGAAAFVVPSGLKLPAVALAIVVAGGTLLAAEPFLRAQTLRGAGVLIASWAVALMVMGGWLLPAAEPYRLAPKVAAGLRQLSEHERASPVLGAFQPPAVVYHFGAPIPVRQDGRWFNDYVRSHGSVAMALTDVELRLMKRERRLDIAVRETLEGFNTERARNERLSLVVIRPATGSEATSSAQAEQPRRQ